MGSENRVGQCGVVHRLRVCRATTKARNVAQNSDEYIPLCVAWCGNCDNRAGGPDNNHCISFVDFRMGSILVQATLARRSSSAIRSEK